MPQIRTTELLMRLLRYAVFGEPLQRGFALSEDDREAVRKLASRHDILHLAEYAAKTGAENGSFGVDACRTAAYRCTLQEKALEQLRGVFEAGKVQFIPLKGSVLRTLYPEPWMRTSADIDVLVRDGDYSAAVSALAGSPDFTLFGEQPHETTFRSSSGMTVELHRSLILPDENPKAAEILSDVWDDSVSVSGGFERRMSDAHFYIYHIAHMAKHTLYCGCGIRFFIDLELIIRQPGHDAEACRSLAEKCGLLDFAVKAEQLADHWFCGGNDYSESLEQFIITGGVFGSTEHAVVASQKNGGSWLCYFMRRLFPPYSRLKYEYPVLKKHAYLIPAVWLRRWFIMLNPRKRLSAISELKVSRTVDSGKIERYTDVLKELGLEKIDKSSSTIH